MCPLFRGSSVVLIKILLSAWAISTTICILILYLPQTWMLCKKGDWYYWYLCRFFMVFSEIHQSNWKDKVLCSYLPDYLYGWLNIEHVPISCQGILRVEPLNKGHRSVFPNSKTIKQEKKHLWTHFAFLERALNHCCLQYNSVFYFYSDLLQKMCWSGCQLICILEALNMVINIHSLKYYSIDSLKSSTLWAK